MALFDSISESKERKRLLRRRRFLTTSLAAVGVFFGYRWWKFRAVPVPQRQTRLVTPNSDFYTIAINPGFRPAIEPDEYQLRVTGPVGARSLTLDEIRVLPSVELHRTLVCVGNPIGGNGMGNAEWKGVRLRDLLDTVADREEGLYAGFYGMDGFYSSVPLEVARDPDTLLAFEMNGEPLPEKHGYPLRVLIPDRYGMKQPRWLERIEVSAENPGGYWERRGWCSECRIYMTARIDSIRGVAGGDQLVRGIAFCGAAAVGQVEVSLDGSTWERAELGEPPAGNRWSTWQWQWKKPASGDHELAVRVRDENGKEQEGTYWGSFPWGATGFHRVTVSL